ncbi:hypothetical protein FDECE_4345 [Fusarium decemcellulare]|nr:hypothetical protein FDECE_4345 [Fusarium decemcellulare]
MAPQELKGIMVALITPFADDGSVDVQGINDHVNRLIDAGVHGLVPTGSTGEFGTLSIAERKTVIEAVIKAAAGRVPVVAGVGSLATAEAVDLAKHHAKAGAAALMVLPPFYEPANLTQLKEWFKTIHDASGLPLVYYNIPAATGTNLSPQDLASLSESGVKYLKDTSGNAPALTELLLGQNKIIAFNGWDTLTFYGIAAGAKGSIWGATNIIPELSIQLWNALTVENDLKKGREIWDKIWPILNFTDHHNYSSAIKTGMELRGWKTGGVRKPFALLENEDRAELAKLLNQAGVKTV